jgi:3-isopropylmalate/(R)-2-methylmalate dehydratase small subunit
VEAFTVLEGLVATLSRDDVDTDQIIPKQFLKSTGRAGYGKACFFDWRYDAEGHDRPDFELNDPEYRGAEILLAGRNFGCGSSREHAVWALAQMGFRVVVAPSFADIFRTNALQNGLLPVALADPVCADLQMRARRRDGYRLTVDLQAEEVRDREGRTAPFQLDPFWRECLLSGLDPLGMALREGAAISAFEEARSPLLPTTRHRWE